MRAPRLVAVALVLAFAAGPAYAQVTFYESYAEGLRLESSGDLAAARAALLRAAHERPEPGRNVKTYGLNFLESYDPYLHLARAELKLGLLEEAEQHLKRSEAARVSPARETARLQAELVDRRRAALPPISAPTAIANPPPTAVPEAEPTPHRTPAAARVEPPAQAIAALVPAAMPTAAAPTRTAKPTRTPAASAASPTRAAEPTAAATALPIAAAPLHRPSPAVTAAPREGGRRGGMAIGAALALSLAVVGAAIYALGRRAGRVQGSAPHRTLDSWMIPTVPRTPTPGRIRSPDGPPSPSRGVDASPLPADGSHTIGGYVIEGVLGRGGMGTTYAARRLRDGLPAALKVPHARVLEDPEFSERFLREAALGATLHHPNIIRIYEAGEEGGKPFFSMEKLAGDTLEARAKRGPMPLRQSLEIARGMALALDYAHLKGIVHRDLKPANVMLLPDGTVKVMDYGVARLVGSPHLTGTLVFLGTPLYCAPEAARGDVVDQQADLYSLGIVLYRMLAGRVPFEASSAFEIFTMHCNAPLPPLPPELGIPPEVFALLTKLTAKSKKERYPTAEAFLRDVNFVLNAL